MKYLRWLALSLLAVATAAVTPAVAWAHDDDEDDDHVLESDEVSGDDEEDEDDEGDEESTTTVIRIKDTDPSAVVVFRDRLSPYGTWVEHASYGTVWVPSSALVGPDFAPYVSSGHWELTEEGDWLWVSDYDWGYIPFHYGRWVWISGLGWAWIPGRVYAPAWVVWRVGAGGYIGWAPMPPRYYWADGVAVSLWLVPPAPYVFCHTTHVYHRHVHRHVVHDHDEVRRAAAATSPYKPASPKKAHKPASPSLKEAGIDPKSAPKSFGKHDKRATDFMRADSKKVLGAGGPSPASKKTGPGMSPTRMPKSGAISKTRIKKTPGPSSSSPSQGGPLGEKRRVSGGSKAPAQAGPAPSEPRAPAKGASPPPSGSKASKSSSDGNDRSSSAPSRSPSVAPRTHAPAPAPALVKRPSPVPQKRSSPPSRSAPRVRSR